MHKTINLIVAFTVVPLVVFGTITTREWETDRSGDGEIDVIVKNTYRDDERILSEMRRDGKTTRIFYSKDRVLMSEEDTTGDGFFNVLWLFENGQPVSAFERDGNGTLTAFSSERLEREKERLRESMP